VSDRWHLVKNLAACVSVQLARTLAQLRRAEERRPAQTQAVQQARQAERTARYEHILELQKQGMKIGEMARTLGMSQRTFQRWIATGNIPYARRKRPRARLIDPYKTYLLKRWHQGCHTGAQLERELRAKGYKGSPHGIYRYLETLKASKLAPFQRKSAAKLASSIQPNALLTLSASQATWLFFRKEEDLKPEEQENLRQLRQASLQLEVTYQLVDEFLHMVADAHGRTA
jgi:transposase